MNKEELIKDLTQRYESSLLTKRQAAKELQISPTQVDRLRKDGTLKSTMLGGLVRIHVSAIADLMGV